MKSIPFNLKIMKTWKGILLLVTSAILLWLIGYIVGRNHRGDIEVMTQMDTVVRVDTVTIERPAEVHRETITETTTLKVTDTLRLRDTLYMVLNKEVKEYKGPQYYARVSGVRPSLDYIEVYPETVTISKTETVIEKPSDWGFTLDCGLDYGLLGERYISPNIGARITYKRLSLGAEGGVGMNMKGWELSNPQLYFQVGVRYSLIGR